MGKGETIMKKILVVIISTALLMSILTGCASVSNNASGTSETATGSTSITADVTPVSVQERGGVLWN